MAIKKFDLDYVYVMNSKEIDNFYAVLRERDLKIKLNSNLKLLENKDSLIKGYQGYEEKWVAVCKARNDKFELQKANWGKKICIECGSSLYFNTNHGFWGCSSYGDGKKHTTFPVDFQEKTDLGEHEAGVSIGKNWIHEILKGLHLNNDIKSAMALCFYQEMGLPDLRIKYDRSSTSGLFGNYQDTKRRTSSEEKEIEGYLKTICEKVTSQIGICYRLNGEVEKICFVDIIASDKKAVFVIEIKTDMVSINQNQLELYSNLIKFYLTSKNDVRVLRSLFIYYHDNGTTWSAARPENAISFTSLKSYDKKTVDLSAWSDTYE